MYQPFKKYYAQTDDVDDLISVGTIGLIKGINTYRPEKGVKLVTYASRCIENEILMFFRGQKKTAGDVSLSDALDPEGEGGGLSMMDVIATEDDMAERIGSEDICRSLRERVDTELTEREANIIRLRYGLTGAPPLTQRETAKELGISRSYVSRRAYCKRDPESPGNTGFFDIDKFRSSSAPNVSAVKIYKNISDHSSKMTN